MISQKIKILVLLFGFVLSMFSLSAQDVVPNNQNDFNPVLNRQSSPYRASLGIPGNQYWQNQADYTIEATLEEEKNTITGTLTLRYHNHSPYDLKYIWMYVEQNRFTETSRGTLTRPSTAIAILETSPVDVRYQTL